MVTPSTAVGIDNGVHSWTACVDDAHFSHRGVTRAHSDKDLLNKFLEASVNKFLEVLLGSKLLEALVSKFLEALLSKWVDIMTEMRPEEDPEDPNQPTLVEVEIERTICPEK